MSLFDRMMDRNLERALMRKQNIVANVVKKYNNNILLSQTLNKAINSTVTPGEID